MRKISFTKGHGTGNDLVLVLDKDGSLDLSPNDVAKICDRHFGVGADGLIRVIPSSLIAEGDKALAEESSAYWFMDYRNADGSIAEICGNGIRVMARYLVERRHQPEGIFGINTRAGMRFLAVPNDDDISVNMGKALVEDDYPEVAVTVGDKSWPAYNINVGNPHAVVFVEDLVS